MLSSCPEVTRLAQGLIDRHDTVVLEAICCNNDGNRRQVKVKSLPAVHINDLYHYM